jgi:beta-lactamase superfamily II metal-dependent hydrolase
MENKSGWNRTESEEECAQRRKERIALVAILIITLAVLAVVFALLHRSISIQNAAVSQPPDSQMADAPGIPSVESGLLVTFLDVGQGDCIFLRSPSGKTMLVDGGPASSYPVIDAYLTSLGVAGLDVVVASHLHADHIGGLISIIDAYPVGEFYYPPFDAESETYFDLLDALHESQAVVNQPLAGADTLISWDDGVEVRILSPYDAVYEDFNDTSYLIRVLYGSTAVLLTGDMTEVGEHLAMKAQPNRYFKADVLKIAHHGSFDATKEDFLDAVSPAIAVISAGVNNDYGHPNPALLDRLSERGITVYRTDTDGTITLLLDGISVTVIE